MPKKIRMNSKAEEARSRKEQAQVKKEEKYCISVRRRASSWFLEMTLELLRFSKELKLEKDPNLEVKFQVSDFGKPFKATQSTFWARSTSNGSRGTTTLRNTLAHYLSSHSVSGIKLGRRPLRHEHC